MFLIWALSVFAALSVIWDLCSRRSPANGFPKVPGDWPLVGHSLFYFGGFGGPSFHRSLFEKYPKAQAVNVRVFGDDVVFILGYDSVKWALSKTGSVLNNLFYERVEELFGRTSFIVTRDVALHKRLKGLGMQAISKDVLHSSFPKINCTARFMIATLATGHPVRINECAKRYTHLGIVQFFFGHRDNDVSMMQAHFGNFITYANGLPDLFLPIWMKGPFAKALNAKAAIITTILGIIEDRRECNDIGFDGLAKMLAATNPEGEVLSDLEIAENVVLLVFGGTDTTAAALSSSVHFYRYVMDPADRIALDEEIQNSNESIDILSLPLLDSFAKELLRMRPPVTDTARFVCKKDATLLQQSLPEGSRVFIGMAQLGYDPAEFPNPDNFMLRRFLDQDKTSKYFPFGSGMRQCPGMILGRLEVRIGGEVDFKH
ncbi:hypothetical protein HDU82_001662 [Entophlyctis luteolus]|nr:hypothetical protein HDU82_001662 [Entophlyctis luteolus]